MAENTEKKKDFFGRMFGAIARFWRDFASEAKKVVWMSGSDVRKNTLLVVAAAVIISVVIGLLDFGFSNAIQALGRLV